MGLGVRPLMVIADPIVGSQSQALMRHPDQNMTTNYRAPIFRKLIDITRLSLFGECWLSADFQHHVHPWPVKEAEYSATIVGDWFGTVETEKSPVLVIANGSFVGTVRASEGFISNTLGQGVTRQLAETGRSKVSLTLSITSAEDERVLNESRITQ